MSEIKKSAITFMPLTTPNSFSRSLLVKAKTAKPMAAAILQNKVTIPMRPTMFISASFLSFFSM